MENKFRIWDGKKFHFPECTEEKSNHVLQFGSNGVFFLHDAEGKFVTSSADGGQAHFFTGLKDKNDKDIYPKDIIKYSHNWDYDPKTGREFSKKKSAFSYGVIEYEYDEYAHFVVMPGRMSLGTSIMLIEKIGNILENPDMIEKYNLPK